RNLREEGKVQRRSALVNQVTKDGNQGRNHQNCSENCQYRDGIVRHRAHLRSNWIAAQGQVIISLMRQLNGFVPEFRASQPTPAAAPSHSPQSLQETAPSLVQSA